MESIQSKTLKGLLRLIRYKRPMALSGDELRRSVTKTRKKEEHNPPDRMKKRYRIDTEHMDGACWYTMRPAGSISAKHILFLHGGGYVYEITNLHWSFLAKLMNELQCTITIPIYPLAPEHGCDETYNMLLLVYAHIISRTNPKDITIMGDSAGGALSLALAQLLNDKQMPQPGNIIMISPTLDLNLTNPEISSVEKIDPLLAVPAAVEFGRWFAGEKGLEHHLISPIYGSLEELGKISLFIGTHDILCPDARRFKRLADEKGITINYNEYPSMIHDWPLLSLPESKRARKQIIDIISDDIF